MEDPVNFVSSSDRYRLPSQDKFNPWTSTTTTSRSPDSSSISPPPQTSFHSTFGPRFLVQGSVSFPTATTMKGKVKWNVNISSHHRLNLSDYKFYSTFIFINCNFTLIYPVHLLLNEIPTKDDEHRIEMTYCYRTAIVVEEI